MKRWVHASERQTMRRSRTIVMTALAFACIASLYSALYLTVGAYLLVGLNTIVVIGALIVLPLQRRRPLRAANICTASGYLCLAPSLAISGGFEARFVFWLIVIPLIGGMLGGLRSGLAWATITAATLLGFVALFVSGIKLPTLVPLGLPPVMLFTQTAGIVAVVAVTMAVFLGNQKQSDQEAQRALEQLQQESKMRRRAEEERVASLGLLAGGIAHDFNNLLAATITNLEVLKTSIKDEEDLEIVSDIRAVLKTGTSLTSQLLTFASGGSPVTEAADLDALLRTTSQFVVRGSPLRCVFELEPNLPPVAINTSQITHVIQDLVLNAQQAMVDSGTLRIKTQAITTPAIDPLDRDCEWVAVEFIDEGPGISAADLPHIFDPYFTKKQGGSGLGLAIASSVVERHGGKLTVQSTVGAGTTFRMLLPKAVSTQMQTSSAELRPIPKGCRVLLMDDDPYVRRATERALLQLEFQVHAVSDGSDVIASYTAATVRDQPFDVVILDLSVPGGMGGLETIAKLAEAFPNVVAIAISGYSSRDVLADPKAHGFAASLQKPFSQKELSKTIISCMTRS